MARLTRFTGLTPAPIRDADIGDLLVYGYYDATNGNKWHGHVVILIDKTGRLTGHKGLVLGAHGGEVGSVQFITFKGFEHGYFKNPRMKLRRVLRVSGMTTSPMSDPPNKSR
ncbi:MAG TPA: hypothetical protein EYQ50_01655 [Verrucomicrobiales bacterium]|nr:hypothetical protein [Verrucomicrobiales bacterium]